jgi:hypothetical protein
MPDSGSMGVSLYLLALSDEVTAGEPFPSNISFLGTDID